MKIFVVPYRNRDAQLCLFLSHLKYLLEDEASNDYRIYIVNQTDDRAFNRGAMRNIGFLEGKKEFPDTYKDIDFVFHDLDNLVGRKNVVEFTTQHGNINHIFGNYSKDNIGGIFVIKGGDYEKTNGFPNLWGWGGEDVVLYYRCQKAQLKLIRNKFACGDTRVVYLDSQSAPMLYLRTSNAFNEMVVEKARRGTIIQDGIFSIKNIKTSRVNMAPSVYMINISTFTCNNSEKNYRPHKKWVIDRMNFSIFLKNNHHLIKSVISSK